MSDLTCNAVDCDRTAQTRYTVTFARASDPSQDQTRNSFTVCNEHKKGGCHQLVEMISRQVNGENRAVTYLEIDDRITEPDRTQDTAPNTTDA